MRSRKLRRRLRRVLSTMGRSFGIAFVLALAVPSCAAPPRAVVIPPCPIPSELAIDDLMAIEGWPLETYVARVERFCEALEALR